MSFNSLFFILLFLPVCLGVYYLLPKRAENFFLLLTNLLFYTFCDELFVLFLLFSALLNYFFGKLIFFRRQRVFLITSILVNLVFLGFFKYYNFFFTSIHDVFRNSIIGAMFPGVIAGLILPLGISFFTFRAISYQVDIYRKKTEPSQNPISFLVYFTLFPLITAGPIIRYVDLREQLKEREVNFSCFIGGLERFVLGLIKKVLIAGTFAGIADRIFSAQIQDLSMGFAWVGILSYTFQIFFDFSGYTDMAIGIGTMLGFNFAENFNFPYMAKNVQDFWNRWHITLSSWLRDYIFLPLAYYISKKLKKERYLMIKTDRIIYFIAIAVTFFICGFWHGAGWTFIIWGLYFALFLVLEQFGMRRLLKRTWLPLQHFYALLVVIVGWVIFRSDNMGFAFRFIGRMFSFSNGYSPLNSALIFYINNTETFLAILMALFFSFPFMQWCNSTIKNNIASDNKVYYVINSVRLIFLVVLFVVSLSYISSSSYQPFIYKQF